MSGPAVPSAGRAVKANQVPSEENAAASPTTVTPLTIARAAAVGAGVLVGVGTGVGVTLAVGVGVGLGGVDAGWLGAVLVAAPVGVEVGVGAAADGTGVGVGVDADEGLADGAIAESAGRATTKTSLPLDPSAPTTIAWPFDGDVMIDFGAAAKVTFLPFVSPSAAQLAWWACVQTWSTGATL